MVSFAIFRATVSISSRAFSVRPNSSAPRLRFLSLSVASFFLSERNFSLDLLGPDASELFDLVLDRLDILDLDRLSDLVLDLLVLDLVLLEVLDLDLLRFSPERS